MLAFVQGLHLKVQVEATALQFMMEGGIVMLHQESVLTVLNPWLWRAFIPVIWLAKTCNLAGKKQNLKKLRQTHWTSILSVQAKSSASCWASLFSVELYLSLLFYGVVVVLMLVVVVLVVTARQH